MKKHFLGLSLLCIALFSCNQKTPQQIAQEAVDRMNAESRHKEVYLDSLLTVAMGNDGYKYMKENRLNAIEKLRVEVPSMSLKWDSLAIDVYKN